jgi:hypothetical protein
MATAVASGAHAEVLLDLFNVKSSMRCCGNRGAAGSYLKQNYEMLAERARGLLSGEVSRPDEQWLQ